MTPKPESETDPWVKVFQTAMEGGWSVYYADEVNAARAAVERQHAAELADCAQAHATERDLAIAVIAERHAAALAEQAATYNYVLREHAEFGGLFQPGGRFHKQADLVLGGSAVRDGGAWLVAEFDKASAELAILRAQVETLTAELDEARAANTANLREMVGMEGRHRASLAAVEGERDRLKHENQWAGHHPWCAAWKLHRSGPGLVPMGAMRSESCDCGWETARSGVGSPVDPDRIKRMQDEVIVLTADRDLWKGICRNRDGAHAGQITELRASLATGSKSWSQWLSVQAFLLANPDKTAAIVTPQGTFTLTLKPTAPTQETTK